MTLLSSRVGLKHRCSIQRLATVSDGGGGTTETWTDHLTDVPCRAWFDGQRNAETAEGGKVTVTEDRRLLVGVDVDVTEADRVSTVTDRGSTIFPGPMRIDAVGRHPDHLDLFVAEVT